MLTISFDNGQCMLSEVGWKVLVAKMTMQLCFQENTDIHYKEGLIGVAMPMKGSGDLYNEVVQEWEDMGETKPLNVSET